MLGRELGHVRWPLAFGFVGTVVGERLSVWCGVYGGGFFLFEGLVALLGCAGGEEVGGCKG